MGWNYMPRAKQPAQLEEVIRQHPQQGHLRHRPHTRWKRPHGRPTEENAHPHRDCTGRIVVVHNGIVENYLELKRELAEEGHTFVTETDTEIIAHLVEQELRSAESSGKTMLLEEAVRRAARRVDRRLRALSVISAGDCAPDDDYNRRAMAAAGRNRRGRGRILRRLRCAGHPAPHPHDVLSGGWRCGHCYA